MADIGWAVGAMKLGERVRRPGWNGKGMWLVLVGHNAWGAVSDAITFRVKDRAPFVAMKTADDKLVPWLCSQTDLLADDWESA
jgi:hypothetical protein